MKPGTIVFRGQTKKEREIIIRYPLKSDVSALRNYINTLSREKTFIRFQGEQVSLADEKKYFVSYKLKIITLGVFANNPIALKMYQKRFDLKEYGRLPQGIKHRGKFVDHIFLYKRV